jgi:hypothetical protein
VSSAQRIGYFVLHFIGMCLAMCIGGVALNAVFFGALALVGITYSREDLPAFALLIIGFNLAITMSVWMRFRGHEWRPTLEMASTSVILALGVIAAGQAGVIDESDRLESLTSLACPVMLIPMFLRWNLYASPHGGNAPPPPHDASTNVRCG